MASPTKPAVDQRTHHLLPMASPKSLAIGDAACKTQNPPVNQMSERGGHD